MDLEINTENLLMELGESADVAAYVASGLAPIDAFMLVGAAGVRMCFDSKGENVDAQQLSHWHSYVENLCSERYSALRDTMPEASREELNTAKDLLVLNGLRRGIKLVMNERYRSIQAANKRSVARPKLAMASAQF